MATEGDEVAVVLQQPLQNSMQASLMEDDEEDVDDGPAPGKPSLTREKNNRYTTTHKFVGITRRAPGDTRSNATRPWRAQVNYMGKAHRAPGNYETPPQAAEAYDDLVRKLNLQKERPVNFVKNEDETAFDRSSTKHAGGRRPAVRKIVGGGVGGVGELGGVLAIGVGGVGELG
eukprot:CAMPEP_0197586052 /NCGR_PEP_ID=MMETSP1326-20131121/8162_1 /TAXON_ID=1155430 /ORGANISM="Genus nov. species nov., Strain RCC2288" /LENGTH=173 /DNA_ID=CAMNT_0043150641 /DNA_START=95 /DNA_END=612 /DNA_ORIENTATION=-